MGWMGLEGPLRKHAGGLFLGRGRVPYISGTSCQACIRKNHGKQAPKKSSLLVIPPVFRYALIIENKKIFHPMQCGRVFFAYISIGKNKNRGCLSWRTVKLWTCILPWMSRPSRKRIPSTAGFATPSPTMSLPPLLRGCCNGAAPLRGHRRLGEESPPRRLHRRTPA